MLCKKKSILCTKMSLCSWLVGCEEGDLLDRGNYRFSGKWVDSVPWDWILADTWNGLGHQFSARPSGFPVPRRKCQIRDIQYLKNSNIFLLNNFSTSAINWGTRALLLLTAITNHKSHYIEKKVDEFLDRFSWNVWLKKCTMGQMTALPLIIRF